MGVCPSRQPPPPPPPPVVVNVQNVPAAEPAALPPAPPPPLPVPEAKAPAGPKRIRKTSAREHRQLALQALFKHSVQKCPTTDRIHISGFCPSSREPTAQMPAWPFCQTCTKAYLKADAASLPENTPEDEED